MSINLHAKYGVCYWMLAKNCHLQTVRGIRDIMGTVWRKTEIIDTFPILCQYFSSLPTCRFFFLFVAKIFYERNFFFTVRRFNSANSIFHRPRCREFNWAQGVSIFVECNMQSNDLSNQILVCYRLHSDGDKLLISFIRCFLHCDFFSCCRMLILNLIKTCVIQILHFYLKF